MGTPSKRRKLNDSSKSSPAKPRSLDYFFGKQKQEAPPAPSSNGDTQTVKGSEGASEMTDEELARKLQAEWDEEAAGHAGGASEALAKREDQPTIASIAENGEASKQITVMDGGGSPEKQLENTISDVKPESLPFQMKGKNTLSLQSTGSEEHTITANIPFDESPLMFDPSKYVAELQSHWAAEDGNASYALLTRCFVLVNSTQSRIKIVDTLVNLLRVIIEDDPSSLLPTVRLYFRNILLSNLLIIGGLSSVLILCNVPSISMSFGVNIFDYRYGSPPTQYHRPTYPLS
jgi:DNA ligase-1